MAITNYSELKAAIADFLNRDDLASVIPTFIRLGEDSIGRDLRHTRQEKRVQAVLDERYENLPTDYLEMRRATLDDGSQLRLISSDDMADMRVKSGDISGKPKYYFITADQIEFYPTPDGGNTVTLLYYAHIPHLDATNDVTWLLQSNSDIYLYSALMHTAAYLQDDQRLTLWASLYKSAVDKLNQNSEKAQYSGSPLVMRF